MKDKIHGRVRYRSVTVRVCFVLFLIAKFTYSGLALDALKVTGSRYNVGVFEASHIGPFLLT